MARAVELKEYTMEEVRRHNNPESCWLVVRGRVYDVTSFVPKHPGSAKAILKHAGTDATTDFDFHSSGAQNLWQTHLIGYLPGHKPWNCVIS